ncbi:MAG: synthetase [Polaromonas sp.]|nr:synthetase [Polaromonas sp.]
MSASLYAQSAISLSLGVRAAFDAATEIAARTRFLADCLVRANRRSLVLGISGGVDSLVSALLGQRAVKEVRQQGREASFIAVRLPYGTQADEADAQKCLRVIQPDITLVVDIKPAADALRDSLQASGMAMGSPSELDFLMGNVKARQRMVAQYAIAGAQAGLVIGTDHAAEALMGFFTKFGDGAADVTPLSGLTKRRVRALGQAMGAPDALVFKTPTADLESLKPLKPDEEAFGVSYEQIDDFLEGKPVDAGAAEIMINAFRSTAHKRALPLAPLVL